MKHFFNVRRNRKPDFEEEFFRIMAVMDSEAIPSGLYRDALSLIQIAQATFSNSKFRGTCVTVDDLYEEVLPGWEKKVIRMDEQNFLLFAETTIAGCVYLTGMIETWGRGIRKVFDECKRHGCPPPVYEVSVGDPGDILVRIDAAPDALLDTPGKTTASLSETVNETVNDQIIKIVKNNPGIRRPRLLKLIPSLTLSTLARRLAELSAQIEFRGAPKTGGYYIKK